MTNLERIETALRAYLSANIPEPLCEAMKYSLLAGGKRLRPMLCLSACEMTGGSQEAALPLACALEMIHTYSLIHDDLPCMDNDDFRRGRPSNHKAFGEANALLAGDGLLTYAFEVILSEGPKYIDNVPRYYEAAAQIASGAGVKGMVAGQWADLANENNASANAEMLSYIHARKTGALITAAVLAGGLVGHADAMELAALRDFGTHFGLLFQITDDLLDVEGNAEKVGKTLGKDAAHAKLTYPGLYGIAETKKMAGREAQSAKDALQCFGTRAAWFLKLADQTLLRSF